MKLRHKIMRFVIYNIHIPLAIATGYWVLTDWKVALSCFATAVGFIGISAVMKLAEMLDNE